MAYTLTSTASGVTITLEPEWGYTANRIRSDSQRRTKAGKLYRYYHGAFWRFKLPLNYVTTSDAYWINNWHVNGFQSHPLIFTDTRTTFSGVAIVGKNLPLIKNVAPYEELYKGVLTLETF